MNKTAQSRRWAYLRHLLLPDRASGTAALRCGADWRRHGARLGAHPDPIALRAHAIMQPDRHNRT
jgi:hypothetical protein